MFGEKHFFLETFSQKTLATYLPWNHKAIRNKFFFTAGALVAGLSVVFATDRADIDYDRECRTYVTLRGGLLFGGDVKGDWDSTDDPDRNRSLERDIKST